MIRYFAYSIRDFAHKPDQSDHRLNWEFWITFNGDVKPCFLDDPKTTVPDANFWILPPGTRYQWKARTRKVERLVIHFAYVPSELERVARNRGYLARMLDTGDLAKAREIARYVEIACVRKDALASLYYQRSACDLALLALHDDPMVQAHAATMETHAAERAEQALALYMEHLYKAPKLEWLATQLHISTSHLRRLFHVQFGRSPKAGFDRIRLERASSLLASSTATLEEVAGQSGFRSTSDFCRVFKRHFGHSPHVWRRSVGVVSSEAKSAVSAVSQRKIVVDWPVQQPPISRKGDLTVWPGGNCKVERNPAAE
jgi:AraC family transcriptional regulator